MRILVIILLPVILYPIIIIYFNKYQDILIKSEFAALERQGLTLTKALALAENQYNLIEKNQNIKDNEIKHFDIPSDQSRNVVMPNPDFLYSTIFYDLSEKDLNINANMPDSTYLSLIHI